MLFNRQEQTQLNKIIFVDVDDTLADTRRAVYDMYVEATGDKSGDINVKSKRYVDFCPHWDDAQLHRMFANSGALYERVKPIEGAKEALRFLSVMGYDIRIATIHTAAGIPAKQLWIEKHFPELANKVYYINSTGSNKDVFIGHSIVDDDAKNIDTNKSTKPILLDVYGIYENRKLQERYAASWKDVVDKLK